MVPSPAPGSFSSTFDPVNTNTTIAVKQRKAAIVFNANESTFPFFSVEVVQGEFDEEGEKFVGRVEKLDLGKFINTDLFSENDRQLIQQGAADQRGQQRAEHDATAGGGSAGRGGEEAAGVVR